MTTPTLAKCERHPHTGSFVPTIDNGCEKGEKSIWCPVCGRRYYLITTRSFVPPLVAGEKIGEYWADRKLTILESK